MTDIAVIYRNVLLLASFKYLWLFLPALLAFLYLVQAGIGIYVFADKSSYEFLGILLAGLLMHVLVYQVMMRYLSGGRWRFLQQGHNLISVDHFVAMVSCAYFVLIVYAMLTSEKIALWEALSGASTSAIAEAREMMFKTRLGWERLLTYSNALFSTALMPFVLALCYVERRRYRHLLFAVFVLSLLPTLEKALILKAILPLVFLAANGYLARHRAVQVFVIAVGVVVFTLSLSKMGGADADMRKHWAESNQEIIKALENLKEKKTEYLKQRSDGQEILKLLTKQRQDLLLRISQIESSSKSASAQKSLPLQNTEEALFAQKLQLSKINLAISQAQKQLDDLESFLLSNENLENYYRTEFDNNREQARIDSKYKIIKHGGQWAFLANRILWIPYVTAYDWLHYFNYKLDGEYLYGRTSLVLSYLSGQRQFFMEKEIFKYQFGYASTSTATANASFLVDAFVNFGWGGVLIFAGVFAVLTGLVVALNNPALQACYYYFAFQASVSGLSGVLFSNGMLLLLLLAVFIRPKAEQETNS